MFFRKLDLAFFIATLAATSVLAQTPRKRNFFQASRALAMGDAYTAYDVGYEAVYYNPAGVAKRNKAQLKFFDLEALSSLSTYNFIKSTYASLGSMQSAINEVKNNAGTVYSMGFNFLPQFLVRNFSIGILARNYTEAYVDPTNSNMNFYAFNDLAVYSQLGAAFFGGILKIGIGGKALDRSEINKIYLPSEYNGGSLSYSKEWKEGVGYGMDAGILLAAPVHGLPTLGIAVQDIGNTTLREQRILFSSSQGQPGSPPVLEQKINVGLSMQAKHGRGNKSFYAIEVKDVQRISSGSASDHLHAGMELDIKQTLYLRGGINQGRYWTAGLGLHVGKSGLEFATYGENVGFNGRRVDDRKYLGRYVLSF